MDTEIVSKPCSKCGSVEKTKSGRCKPCNRAWMKEWWSKNPTYKKEFAEKHSETKCKKCGAVERNHRGECMACIRTRNKERLASIPEAKAVKSAGDKKWREENKQRKSLLDKSWRENNKERKRQSNIDWEKRNPEKVREGKAVRAHKRREIIRSVGNLSYDIRERLIALQKGKCIYCRCKMVKSELDHIIPLSKGGPNVDSNIQLLCPSCNRSKSAKHPTDFAVEMGFLI